MTREQLEERHAKMRQIAAEADKHSERMGYAMSAVVVMLGRIVQGDPKLLEDPLIKLCMGVLNEEPGAREKYDELMRQYMAKESA